MKTVPIRFDKLLNLAAFLTFVHTLDPADDLLLAPLEENTAKKVQRVTKLQEKYINHIPIYLL